MPNYYNRSGWVDAGHAATQLAGSLQGLALDVGRSRYQRQAHQDSMLYQVLQNQQMNKHRSEQLRLQEQHYAAQNAEAAAQGQFHQARTQGLQDSAGQGQALGAIMQYMQNNPGSEQDLMGDAVGLGTQLASQHPANMMESIAQAAQMGNSDFRNALALGGVRNTYNNVPLNSTAVTPFGPTVEGRTTLTPGAVSAPGGLQSGGMRTPDMYGMPAQPRAAASQDLGRFNALTKYMEALKSPFGPPDVDSPNYGAYNQANELLTNSPIFRPSSPGPAFPPAQMPMVDPGVSGMQVDPSAAFQVPPITPSFPQFAPPRSEPGDYQEPQMPEFDPSATFEVPPMPEYMSTDTAPRRRPVGTTKHAASSASLKAIRANDLEREHPTLTREQIIDMVNAEFDFKPTK